MFVIFKILFSPFISMAAVTNYRKLGGSEQQEFILSQFWRPERKINNTPV